MMEKEGSERILGYYDEMNLLLCPDKWTFCGDNPLWFDLAPILKKLEACLEKVRQDSDLIRNNHHLHDDVRIRLAPDCRHIVHKSRESLIVLDEFLFMHGPRIISTKEVEVEEKVERQKYAMMVEACGTIKRYIDNPIRQSEMLISLANAGLLMMLCANLDRRFDTVRRIKQIHQYEETDTWLPPILPSTSTDAMLVMISSVSK